MKCMGSRITRNDTNKVIDGIKYADPQLLIKFGLLYEINRTILHPLGLALGVQSPNSRPEANMTEIKLWDCREDKEGVIFQKKTFNEGRKKLREYYKVVGKLALREREKRLGYIYQEKG